MRPRRAVGSSLGLRHSLVKSDPVTPEDIAATIYRAMGIDAETRIYDQQQRPSSVALGEPIERLFG